MELFIVVPSTEQWIIWSEGFAFRQYSANRQLSIEVAMACCRYYRDSRGMSRDQNLADADHYWLGRLFGFMAQSGHQLSRHVDGGRGTTSVAIGDVLALLGWSVGAAPMILQTVAWDAVKRSGALDRVMEERDRIYRQLGWHFVKSSPASASGGHQVRWAIAGYGHAGLFDMPFARGARLGFRLAELPPGEMLTIPPAPH